MLNTYNKPTWLTPYNTGKVQIGALYTPKTKPHPMSADAYRLQTALLRKAKSTSKAKPETTRMAWARLTNFLKAWRLK